MNNKKPMRFLKLPEVIERTGKSRSSIYRESLAGIFPSQIKTGEGTVGWLESEIEAWIQKCVSDSKATKQ